MNKTISLEEAYKKATKGPLIAKKFTVSARGKHIFYTNTEPEFNGIANAALLAHSFNVLPKVVKALNEARNLIKCVGHGRGVTYDAILLALAEASTVEVPD